MNESTVELSHRRDYTGGELGPFPFFDRLYTPEEQPDTALRQGDR